jgi:hypothetical protein
MVANMWKDNLKGDKTEWLLEPSDPSVRYWALKDLQDLEEDSPDVVATRDAIMRSPIVTAILGAMNPEGYWENPDDMYLPKYTASTHQLLILAELGARRTSEIEKAVEHLFKFQRNSGHFLTKLPKTERGRDSAVKDGCCFDGNILHYLIRFGYLDDPRTQSTLSFQVEYHDDDNAGWRCRAYPIDPEKVFPVNCYMGATKVLKALSLIPEEKRSPEIRRVILREVGNLMDNNVYQYLRNPDGSRKDKTGWKRFGFPLFYQTDILEILDTLTRLGVRDPRMKPSIDLVLDAQQRNGAWLLKHTFNGKMIVDIDEKHKPSKWITLRAMRVLKRYYSSMA